MTIEQVCHFQARNTPVPFLVLHRVRAGEGCGFLGEMTIEQVWHFPPRSTPVPFLVLHRVRAGEGCRVAHMLVNVTQSLSCCSLDTCQRRVAASAAGFSLERPCKLAMVRGVETRRIASLRLVKLSVGKEVPRLQSGFCLKPSRWTPIPLNHLHQHR